jgi:hypothetical protein
MVVKHLLTREEVSARQVICLFFPTVRAFQLPVVTQSLETIMTLFNLQKLLWLVTSKQQSNFSVEGLFLNVDAGFDTVPFKKCLFKHDIFDHIDTNKRNGKNDVSFLDEALYR